MANTSMILRDINKELRSIINHIAFQFLRDFPLGQVKMACGTAGFEGRVESMGLREV